jgi:protein SCO1/2
MIWSSLQLGRCGVLALAMGLALGCAPRETADDGAESFATNADANPYGLRGRVLPGPLAKPDVVLTDTEGQPFDLRRETDGYLTLLFFGYTYCPDICPIHMANLGAVIGQMAPGMAQRIKVVFVTTDPARDTPERLGMWLANFNAATLNAAQQAVYLPLPQYGPTDSTGAYLVGHAAAVVAFSPDNLARVLYPFGIRQADWAHDLPVLLEMKWPE